MSIWEARDRQGLKVFSQRPTYHMLHEIYMGSACRKPRKGDRVIRKFKPNIIDPLNELGNKNR
jgi:hypothetical protein